MFNYIIISNKRFNDYEFLQEKLDVFLSSKKGLTKLWYLRNGEQDKKQKKLSIILKKYCNWNNIELHNLAEEELEEQNLDDIIVFEDELDLFLQKTYKNLWKYERYKPIKFIKK